MTKKDYVAEAKREYMREWRKNNREKLKAAQKGIGIKRPNR